MYKHSENRIGNATRSVLGDEMDRQFKNAVRQTLNLDDGNNSSQYNFPEQNLSNNTEDNCLILSNTEGEIAKDIILTHPNLAEWEFSDGAAELVMAYSYKHPNVKKYGIGIVVDDGNEYFYHEDNVNGSYTDMSEENVRKALSNRFKMSVNVSFADLSCRLTSTAGTGYMKFPGFSNVIFDITEYSPNFNSKFSNNFVAILI